MALSLELAFAWYYIHVRCLCYLLCVSGESCCVFVFLVVVNEREQVSVIEQMLEGYCMVDTWMSEELYIPEWLKHGN